MIPRKQKYLICAVASALITLLVLRGAAAPLMPFIYFPVIMAIHFLHVQSMALGALLIFSQTFLALLFIFYLYAQFREWLKAL